MSSWTPPLHAGPTHQKEWRELSDYTGQNGANCLNAPEEWRELFEGRANPALALLHRRLQVAQKLGIERVLGPRETGGTVTDAAGVEACPPSCLWSAMAAHVGMLPQIVPCAGTAARDREAMST
jgi:hypothetical protein